MKTNEKTSVTIETLVNKPVEHVWRFWTEPDHIRQWNFASDDWQSPSAVNNLKPGGRFSYRMEAKDESVGFDFCGTYSQVEINKLIKFILDDNRKVSISFNVEGNSVRVTEVFETEDVNPIDLQRNGWQSILNNFKKYAESV